MKNIMLFDANLLIKKLATENTESTERKVLTNSSVRSVTSVAKTRVLKICVLALISVLWIAITYTHTYAQEPEPIGIVTAVKGQVTVVSAGVSEAVEEGARVFLGDRFETGEDSGVKILFNDDTLISLGANTTFEITEFVYTTARRKSLYNIITGKLKAIIQKFEGEESDIEFATPGGVAGIKGTIIFIDADMNIFFVLEGEAFVRGVIPGAREIWLRGGEFTGIQPDGNPSDPALIPLELKGELEKGTEVQEEVPPRDSLLKEEYPGKEPPPKSITAPEIMRTGAGVLPPLAQPVDLLPGVTPQDKAPVDIVIPPPQSP